MDLQAQPQITCQSCSTCSCLNHGKSGCQEACLSLRLIVKSQRKKKVNDNESFQVLDVPPPILGRPLADLASALADVYRVPGLHHGSLPNFQGLQVLGCSLQGAKFCLSGSVRILLTKIVAQA